MVIVLTTMLSDVMEENRQTLAELTAHEQQLGTKLGKFGKQFDETAKRLSEQLKVSLSKEKSSNHEKFDMNGWTPRVFTSLLNQEVSYLCICCMLLILLALEGIHRNCNSTRTHHFPTWKSRGN